MKLTRNYIAERSAGDLQVDWGWYMSELLDVKGTILRAWPFGCYGKDRLISGVILREVRIESNKRK